MNTFGMPLHEWDVGNEYRCLSLLGNGSYGSVCMGEHIKSGKKVAIKQMRGIFDNETDCKRILREIKLLRRLDHPYIIKLYDIVEPHNLDDFTDLYIVLELADSDLKKVLKSALFLSPMHIKTILYNLLCALYYLHSAQVLHRDLKPANVLVDESCAVKLWDFGLARSIAPKKVREEFKEEISEEILAASRAKQQQTATTPNTATSISKAKPDTSQEPSSDAQNGAEKDQNDNKNKDNVDHQSQAEENKTGAPIELYNKDGENMKDFEPNCDTPRLKFRKPNQANPAKKNERKAAMKGPGINTSLNTGFLTGKGGMFSKGPQAEGNNRSVKGSLAGLEGSNMIKAAVGEKKRELKDASKKEEAVEEAQKNQNNKSEGSNQQEVK